MSTLAPDIPPGATHAERCQHLLVAPRRRWWRDDLEEFATAPTGERRYELAGQKRHSRDGSVCDQD